MQKNYLSGIKPEKKLGENVPSGQFKEIKQSGGRRV